jgi:hypothetical protein
MDFKSRVRRTKSLGNAYKWDIYIKVKSGINIYSDRLPAKKGRIDQYSFKKTPIVLIGNWGFL